MCTFNAARGKLAGNKSWSWNVNVEIQLGNKQHRGSTKFEAPESPGGEEEEEEELEETGSRRRSSDHGRALRVVCRESQREVVLALVIGGIRAGEKMTDQIELGRL